MAKAMFRKGTTQRSKRGLIVTKVLKIGGIKYAIQYGVEIKEPKPVVKK